MTVAVDLTSSRMNFALDYAKVMFEEAKRLIAAITVPGNLVFGASDTAIDGTVVTDTLQSLMTAVPELDPRIMAALLNNILNGPLVLSPAIEQDIWLRGYERDSQALQDGVDKITNQWAKMNFSLPDGLLSGTILAINLEHEKQLLDRSRDIAIKQAQMAMDNYFKSIQSAIEVYKGAVDGFRAEVTVWVAQIEASQKNKDITLRARIAEVEAGLKNLDIQSKILEWWYNLSFEKSKSVATLAAQIASGALAGATAQSSVSYTEAMDVTPA